MALRLARDALATPDLRRLQLAWAASAVGGWAFMVALAVYAYAAGGAAGVGLAAVVRMLPAGLAAPLMGLAADRFPRRDVLLASTLARALLLAAAALAVALGAPFALVLVLAVLFTVAQAAHKPAQAALLPHLAPGHDRRAAANALWSAIDNTAFIAGAIAAGLLTAAAGTAVAFAATTATFALATILLARIGRDPAPREHKGSDPLGLLEGVRVVAREPRLRVLVGVLTVSTLIEGMVDVLVVVTALEVVNLGEAGVGWLNGAWGVGGLVGGVVALQLIARGRLRIALPAGLLLVGAPLIALAALPLPLTALVFLTILGLGYTLVEVAGLTLLQRLARDAVRARAFAVVESTYWLATGAGAMLAPLVVALAGPRGALAIVGAALPLIVLAQMGARAALPRAPSPAPAPRRATVA